MVMGAACAPSQMAISFWLENCCNGQENFFSLLTILDNWSDGLDIFACLRSIPRWLLLETDNCKTDVNSPSFIHIYLRD